MKTRHNDWTITVKTIEDDYMGKGFDAEFYIPKTDGQKHYIRQLRCFDENIRTQKQMIEYVISIINVKR